IPWATYDEPATLVLSITYLPEGRTTFFGAPEEEVSEGELPSGITLPPFRGITPPEEEAVTEAPERVQEFNLTFALERETPVAAEGVAAPEEEEEIAPSEEEEFAPVEEVIGVPEEEFGEEFIGEEEDRFTFGDEDGLVVGGDAEEEFAEEEFAAEEEPGFLETIGDFFTGLFGGEGEEVVGEEAVLEEELAAEEGVAEAEQFTPDASSLVVLDYTRGDNEVSAALSLDGLFEFDETPLVASLIFASVANPSKQLEFSEAITDDLAVQFAIPRNVLRTIGSEQWVLLKLVSDINGLPVVGTYVLGVAHNL
ncbi:MAG: hypothetical protein HYW56_02255, partial [Candidatus Harrisonbacteria bacterium]|nr:hypothetical protein [Candidatus Harrisonbacteria bacterium]